VLLKRNTGKMVDERQRVIRDLLVRLEEAGICPNEPFDAVFTPGVGWRFEQGEAVSSSSSSAGGARHATGQKPIPK